MFRASSCPSSGAYKLLLSAYPSGRNNSAPTAQSLIKYGTAGLLKNLSRKFKFHFNLRRITGTLQEDKVIFIVISRSVLLRVRNVSDRSYRENQNTNFMSNNFFSKIVGFLGIVEKFFRAGQATDHNTAHAHCLLDKRLQAQSEYVIIVAFPLQQWLHERASMLRYSALPVLLNSN
jgi:hypothetical protein